MVLPGNRTDPEHQYHCAPTPVISHQGRLYRAFETSTASGYGHYTAMLAWVDEKHDLLDASAWGRSSNALGLTREYIPEGWQGSFGWQEGNAVVGPDGKMWNILRVDGQTNVTYNKAAITRLQADGSMLFSQMIDFPSTSSKFSIKRHPESGVYYTLSTSVTQAAVKINAVFARNNLVLSSSNDLLTWKICSTLLTDDTGFGVGSLDSARYTGFHYVDWVFDGEDILYAVRSGYRGANSYHNANRITFKKILGFVHECIHT